MKQAKIVTIGLTIINAWDWRTGPSIMNRIFCEMDDYVSMELSDMKLRQKITQNSISLIVINGMDFKYACTRAFRL